MPFYHGDGKHEIKTIASPPVRNHKPDRLLIVAGLCEFQRRYSTAGTAGVKRYRPDDYAIIREILQEHGPSTLSFIRAYSGKVHSCHRGWWKEFAKRAVGGKVACITVDTTVAPYSYSYQEPEK